MKEFDFDASKNLPEELRVNPLKDEKNPRSVINICPSSVANAIRYIPDSVFSLGPDELKRAAKCGEVEERLRIAFWLEYDRAQSSGKNINISNVYGGICTQHAFLRTIVSNSFKMAYVLTPPVNYEVQMVEMLNLGLEQLRDILMQPHVDDQGRPNPKMADVKQKIVESLHLRVKGAVPYRMETKNLNVNVDQTSRDAKSDTSQLKSMAEIEAKLKELEAKANGPSVREVIDVNQEESRGDSEDAEGLE